MKTIEIILGLAICFTFAAVLGCVLGGMEMRDIPVIGKYFE